MVAGVHTSYRPWTITVGMSASRDAFAMSCPSSIHPPCTKKWFSIRANASACLGSAISVTSSGRGRRVTVEASQVVQATPAGRCTAGSGSNSARW